MSLLEQHQVQLLVAWTSAPFAFLFLRAISLQPCHHIDDFLLLGVDHLLRHVLGPLVVAVRELGLGHIDGSLVMRDHAAHECHV